jgi:hypothetical protein
VGVILAVVGALVLVPTLLFLPLRWAFGTVIDGTADARIRRAVLALGALAVAGRRAAARHGACAAVARRGHAGHDGGRRRHGSSLEMSGAGVRALGPAPVIESTLAACRAPTCCCSSSSRTAA